jgi:hypothetical protein
MQNPDLIGTVHDFLISKKLARGFLVIEIFLLGLFMKTIAKRLADSPYPKSFLEHFSRGGRQKERNT